MKMEEFAEKRMHFMFLLSIGQDPMMPTLTGHSLKNIKLTL
jgi:hypothetical protein